MTSNDGSADSRGLRAAYERAIATHATGCPRCGSTCGFLDDCAVCLGQVICAHCLFGRRVAVDEPHTTFVVEG